MLLGTKTKVRLLKVLAASGDPMTRNELANLTHSGIRSTYEQIEELIAIGVLKEIENGRSRVALDPEFPFYDSIRDLFHTRWFRKLQLKYGIPAHLVETWFWHLEILHRMKPISEFLVFKGGTCVQSFVDPMFQRASNDLDFNTTIENPNALIQKIEELNKHMIEIEIALELQGVGKNLSGTGRSDVRGQLRRSWGLCE